MPKKLDSNVREDVCDIASISIYQNSDLAPSEAAKREQRERNTERERQAAGFSQRLRTILNGA